MVLREGNCRKTRDRRLAWLSLLLLVAGLLAPRIEASRPTSRTGVWESNPPAVVVLTRAGAASALASLSLAATADAGPHAEITEPPRFVLGDVILVESQLEHEDRFGLGPLDLLGPAPLRGPPPSYPETRVRGLELLPPFRVGASASLSLWSRQACGSISCGLVSDGPQDPWGLCPGCGTTFSFQNNPSASVLATGDAIADAGRRAWNGPWTDQEEAWARNRRVRDLVTKEPQSNGLSNWLNFLSGGGYSTLNRKLLKGVDEQLAPILPTNENEDVAARWNLMMLPAVGTIEGPGAAVRPGVANNMRGGLYENLLDAASRRLSRYPFFRPARRGGIDIVTLEGGDVVLNEAKFARSLQFDDFSAITTNLRSNVEEILESLHGSAKLSRTEKEAVRTTLSRFLEGETPSNLRIRVVTGNKAVGPKLQKKLEKNVEGLQIEFAEYPER